MGTTQFNPKTGGRAIEWTDRTSNPIGGCKHACRWEMPDGTTAVCYAEQVANGYFGKAGYPHGFEHHYWRGNGLRDLVAGRDPMFVFCDSMSDLFGAWVPTEQTTAVLRAMSDAPQHTYQSLTKAPGRLRGFLSAMPENLWVGVSSAPDWFKGKRLDENQQARYTLAALAALRQVREKTGSLVWMSLEPVSWDMAHLFADHPLDWVVIGAAMNGRKYFQPDPGHIRKLLDVFDQSETPVFFKGNIKPTLDAGFGDERLNRWREDFPVAYRDGRWIPAVLRRQVEAAQHGWTLNQALLHEGVGPDEAGRMLPAAVEAMRPQALLQPSLF